MSDRHENPQYHYHFYDKEPPTGIPSTGIPSTDIPSTSAGTGTKKSSTMLPDDVSTNSEEKDVKDVGTDPDVPDGLRWFLLPIDYIEKCDALMLQEEERLADIARIAGEKENTRMLERARQDKLDENHFNYEHRESDGLRLLIAGGVQKRLFHDRIRIHKPLLTHTDAELFIYIETLPKSLEFAFMSGKQEVMQELQHLDFSQFDIAQYMLRCTVGPSADNVVLTAGLKRIALGMSELRIDMYKESTTVGNSAVLVYARGFKILLNEIGLLVQKILARTITRATYANAYKRAFGINTDVILVDGDREPTRKNVSHSYTAYASGMSGTTWEEASTDFGIPLFSMQGLRDESILERLNESLTEEFREEVNMAYQAITSEVGISCEMDDVTMMDLMNSSFELVTKFQTVESPIEAYRQLAVIHPLTRRNFKVWGLELVSKTPQFSREVEHGIQSAKLKLPGFPDVTIRGTFLTVLPDLSLYNPMLPKHKFNQVFLSAPLLDKLPTVAIGCWFSWGDKAVPSHFKEVKQAYRLIENGFPVADLVVKSRDQKPVVDERIELVENNGSFDVTPTAVFELLRPVNPLVKHNMNERASYFNERALSGLIYGHNVKMCTYRNP